MIKILSNNTKDMIDEIYKHMSRTTNLLTYVCINATLDTISNVRQYFAIGKNRLLSKEDIIHSKHIEFND